MTYGKWALRNTDETTKTKNFSEAAVILNYTIWRKGWRYYLTHVSFGLRLIFIQRKESKLKSDLSTFDYSLEGSLRYSLNINGWKRNFLLGWNKPLQVQTVSFRECNIGHSLEVTGPKFQGRFGERDGKPAPKSGGFIKANQLPDVSC